MAITCKNCGQILPDNSSFCSKCGVKTDTKLYCPKCGTEVDGIASFCPNCGEKIGGGFSGSAQYDQYQFVEKSKLNEKKIITGVLALCLGALGIQYFYINKPVGGIVTIVLTLCSCGVWSLLMLIQGIRILIMDDEDFKNVFLDESKVFPIL